MAAKAKLDMKHGFMKSIVRNQVARDEYDKEVKAKIGDKKQTTSKSKRPEIQPYVPPPKSKSDQQTNQKEQMFRVEFEDKDGQMYSFIFYEDDSPSAVARQFGMDRGLPSPLISALADRLLDEMNNCT
ncbi:UPF0561 protein C2orf68 homolog isoform X2 [Lingula anatina]|uniref:UPF0561 protein C2orf68 homolog isoform X1 n=1 Tax=Lingula anatina TaxID=7574 RepID=A0A1S3JLX1_LINAN|nr:UPF0561 protein C2orf68 homolog isoform X1 [Lingula anatina]XP_013411411.1 UPF0561 protein C2orf68 homolog isoform X2 [Lingula anatina]|eukprot:XP_013411410.1 UPF0561 protein C2orf68 homolog isoform X1 [Lingula anatina]